MLSHGEPVTWTTCSFCWAYIPRDNINSHLEWHYTQNSLEEVAHIHQEHLIERMQGAEKQIEAAVARIYFLERQVRGLPPTGDPQGHHHQAY